MSFPNFDISYDLRRAIYAALHTKSYRRGQALRRSTGVYNYECFDRTRSLFVHIPKAAGVSVCQSLYGCLAGGHATMAKYQQVFSRHEYNNYYKFTFVRNPWDRLFSAYSFLRKGGMNEVDKRWANQNLVSYLSFESFVMDWLNPKSVNSYIHFKPQKDFLVSFDGELRLDFLGRFESINQDFALVAKYLGLHTSLSHQNATGHSARYLDAYTEDMIQKVADVYAQDIELLGYRFDGLR